MPQHKKTPSRHSSFAVLLSLYCLGIMVGVAAFNWPWYLLPTLLPNFYSIFLSAEAHFETRHSERHLKNIEAYAETLLALNEEKQS